jgi:hypothetical protein
MINRRLKDFFMNRSEHKDILTLLKTEELSIIERFLSTNDQEYKELLAPELMELTLQNIDPETGIFQRLFETESNKLSEMEKGIVYIKEDYRSHFIHSVYTYLMGFFLLQEDLLGKDFLDCVNLDYFDGHYDQRPVYDRFITSKKNEWKEFQRRWALTAFFHDLTYLSEINLKIMQAEGKRLVNIERPYSIEISDLQAFLTNHAATQIKSQLKMSFTPDYLFHNDVLEIIACRMVNRIGDFSKKDIYQSLIEWVTGGLKDGRFDHGVVGAVSLLHRLYSLIHSFYFDRMKKDLPHRYKLSINRNIIRFTDAMTAAALHNVKYFKQGIFKEELGVKITNHRLPLAFLLIISDELQTWQREMEPPTGYKELKRLRVREKGGLDKTDFEDYFLTLYKDYSLKETREDAFVFYIPFWDDDDESKAVKREYFVYDCNRLSKIIENIVEQLKDGTLSDEKENEIESLISNFIKILGDKKKITFRKKNFFALERVLNGSDDKKLDDNIKKRNALNLQKEMWEKFKKENITMEQFIGAVFGFESFLKKQCSISDNNKKVGAIEKLNKEILPNFILLKKGQDKLSPHVKPYHFHDIEVPLALMGDTKNDQCKLLLHYPGKEVYALESALKKRIEKKLCREKRKDMTLKYPDAPVTGLNTIINNHYIPRMEKYLYGILNGEFGIREIQGEENGGE